MIGGIFSALRKSGAFVPPSEASMREEDRYSAKLLVLKRMLYVLDIPVGSSGRGFLTRLGFKHRICRTTPPDTRAPESPHPSLSRRQRDGKEVQKQNGEAALMYVDVTYGNQAYSSVYSYVL